MVRIKIHSICPFVRSFILTCTEHLLALYKNKKDCYNPLIWIHNKQIAIITFFYLFFIALWLVLLLTWNHVKCEWNLAHTPPFFYFDKLGPCLYYCVFFKMHNFCYGYAYRLHYSCVFQPRKRRLLKTLQTPLQFENSRDAFQCKQTKMMAWLRTFSLRLLDDRVNNKSCLLLYHRYV